MVLSQHLKLLHLASIKYRVHCSSMLKISILVKYQALTEFVEEFISDRATGKFGYLSDRGLIPLPEGMVKITLVK
jgi:hypothetical protein